jgi:tetratricopeptide (TPR) repeat protein
MAIRRVAALLALSLCLLLHGTAFAQSDELQDANQLFKQGQFDRALDRVNIFLSGKPKDARGRFLKGLIFTEQNKPNDAIKIFTELTQDFPELPEPYNNLAVLYASQGQYDKARTALEMAIRTHPSYATAHENLGDIYAKMASQAYDKALQLDRSNQGAQGKLNLIKELFSSGQRPLKPALGKAESVAKPPVQTAAATPAAPTPPAKPPVQVTVPPPKPAEPVAAAPKAPPETPAKAATAPAPAKAAPAAATPDEVVRAVNQWARAWSSNDVQGYLAHYASDFKTPAGEARAAWESQRKARIGKPKKIHVAVESPKVTFNDKNRATVTFRQTYRSDSMKTSSTKTLVMVKTGDKWLIQQERVGS